MKLLVSLFLFFCLANVYGQSLLSDSSISLSYCVKNTADNSILEVQTPERRLISASLLKVVTTATALELLGSDYQFKTAVGYEGEIIDGVLNGDIIIKAGLDPTLGSQWFDCSTRDSVLNRIVSVIRSKGVVKIQGNVVIAKDFEVPYSSPRLWEDMGNYYGAKPNAFNWHDNLAYITLTSEMAGSICKVKSVKPDITPYILESRVLSATHHKDSAYVYGNKEISKWWIEGSIPENRSEFVIKGALPNTESSFVNDLKEAFYNNNILILDENQPSEDKEVVYLYEIESPKLSEIIKVVNHKSNNLFADALLLTLGKEYKHKADWDSGVEVIVNFWRDKIDFESQFRMKDGSGLSPKNLISANGMVDLLQWMDVHSSNRKIFRESLAKGGQSGTLKSVFRSSELEGKVIGKSGSMEGVLGYCGYFTKDDGTNLAFCFVVNNYLEPARDIRQKIDEILTEVFKSQL